MSQKSVVSIVKGENLGNLVRQALEYVGGIETVVKKGDVVLIKPNLVGLLPPSSGATSDPEIVEVLAVLSNEAGAKEVIIGEGSSSDTHAAFRICGYEEVARKTGARLVDLDEDEAVEVKVANAFIFETIKVARTVVECDVIVNVPKMKTQVGCVLTGGLKNMLGVLPGASLHPGSKRDEGPKDSIIEYHARGLNYAIVDLNTAFKPDLTVVDGFIAMEGHGPIDGDPVPMKTVLAGLDPVAVDAVEAAIMGFDPQKIFYISLASKAGLGVGDLRKIEVRGKPIRAVMRSFKPYFRSHKEDFGLDYNVLE